MANKKRSPALAGLLDFIFCDPAKDYKKGENYAKA